MALGPGALSLLLQPTHVNNPARGDGVFRAADQLEQQRQNQWYRGQREQETAEQRRQFDVSHGLEQKKFDYLGQEKRRTEEMSVYDELLEAEASQDPQKMLAALNKARARGVTAPGYEEKINELFKSGGEKGEATQPEETPTAQPKPEAPTKGGIRGPIVGESIGDGWEVVETPPEATGEPERPAQWLTNEMEARGEIPVQPMPGWERSPFTGEMLPPLPQESVTTQNGMSPQGGPWNDGVQRGPVGPIEPIPNHVGGPQQPTPIPNHIGGPPGLRGGLPQGPAPQQAPAPSGATVVYGSDGKPLGTVDPETAMARSRERVRAALSPLTEQARTPEEKRAAAIAMDSGQRLVGSMTVDKIIQNAQERYDAELGRDTAKTVARGGKAAGAGEVAAGAPPDKTMYERAGRSPEEIRAIAAIGNYVHTKIIQKAQQVHNTKELQRVAGTARAVAAKVNKEGGFAQRQSIRDILRMTEGARQTDADLNYALRGDGALGQLHLKLNEYIASGTLPHNFKQQISDYATLLDAHNRDRQKKAAAYAREFAMQDTGLRDMVGEEDLAHWAEQAARGAMGEAIGPTPKKATGNREVDSLVEELEGAD